MFQSEVKPKASNMQWKLLLILFSWLCRIVADGKKPSAPKYVFMRFCSLDGKDSLAYHSFFKHCLIKREELFLARLVIQQAEAALL